MRLRKLVQKVLLTVIFVTTFASVSNGQGIKIDGPLQAEAGELIRISLSSLDGLNDPKIECVPKNDAWEAVRKLDGSPVILFYTKREGLYTFIVCGNKDNKTVLATFQIQVGKSVPTPGPGPPTPVIPTGKYTTRLKPTYMVSPDAASLDKLIAVYQSMATNASSVQNYSQMNAALAAATKGAIGDINLRAVRDEVATILQTDLANRNSTKYDPVATASIFQELAKSLTELK